MDTDQLEEKQPLFRLVWLFYFHARIPPALTVSYFAIWFHSWQNNWLKNIHTAGNS